MLAAQMVDCFPPVRRYGYAIATTSHVMLTYLHSLCSHNDNVSGKCAFTIDYSSIAR